MDFCQQNFQNIVTWGVQLQSRNVGVACFSMESWISGVPPSVGYPACENVLYLVFS